MYFSIDFCRRPHRCCCWGNAGQSEAQLLEKLWPIRSLEAQLVNQKPVPVSVPLGLSSSAAGEALANQKLRSSAGQSEAGAGIGTTEAVTGFCTKPPIMLR